ncbi:MAG: DUF4199 domain-containing protein [Ponticaulis sp.]|mgnify:CR=1 FL=1|nr:DUF4199 domain-containing protein [Ponticaulis sp.]
MLKRVLLAGLIAGVISGLFMYFTAAQTSAEEMMSTNMLQMMAAGYASMLIALAFIFIAIKRQRDIAQGGVIKFPPAFGMGLAITLVAGIIYALAWEASLVLTDYNFIGAYEAMLMSLVDNSGKTGEELEAYRASMLASMEAYKNPVSRLPMTFMEIAPVGVLVSLVSALLLRNSRFLPHKPVV